MLPPVKVISRGFDDCDRNAIVASHGTYVADVVATLHGAVVRTAGLSMEWDLFGAHAQQRIIAIAQQAIEDAVDAAITPDGT